MSKFDSSMSLKLVGSIKAIERIQEKDNDENYLKAYFYLAGDNKPYELNITDDSGTLMEELREHLGDRVKIATIRKYPSTVWKEAGEPVFPEENAFIGKMIEYRSKRLDWSNGELHW